MQTRRTKGSRCLAVLDAVFCPRPRVWSSAVVFFLLALGLSVVVPASTHSSVSVSNGFFALVDESGIAINTSLVERPRERWNVDVTWNRGEGNGRITAAVQTRVVRRVGPDDRELPPPTQQEIDAVLLAWAEQERADPLLAEAIRNGGSIVKWDATGVAAVVGKWAMFLLVIAGLVLVIGRAAVKRYFEKCIAAWHDGKCPQCGYVMEGTRSGRCPECGCVGAEHVKVLEGILRGRPAAVAAST